MTLKQKTPGAGASGGSMVRVKPGSFDTIKYSRNHLNLKIFEHAMIGAH